MLLQHQDRRLLAAIERIKIHENRSGPIAKLHVIRGKLGHMVWSILSSSNISREANIAITAKFPHLVGVVIHEHAVVEGDCMIMQQVTLGQTGDSGAPHVKKGAYIGAGAKILGDVTIGENARVGANAVVLSDVPPNCTAVGVPARILSKS